MKEAFRNSCLTKHGYLNINTDKYFSKWNKYIDLICLKKIMKYNLKGICLIQTVPINVGIKMLPI